MIRAIIQSTGHSVRRVCASLQVPRSSYYHAASFFHSDRRSQYGSRTFRQLLHRAEIL